MEVQQAFPAVTPHDIDLFMQSVIQLDSLSSQQCSIGKLWIHDAKLCADTIHDAEFSPDQNTAAGMYLNVNDKVC